VEREGERGERKGRGRGEAERGWEERGGKQCSEWLLSGHIKCLPGRVFFRFSFYAPEH
jgi:hypothetical protein